MFRRLALAWFVALLALGGPQVRAQIPFHKDLIPSRTSLARLGLERQWLVVVPLYGSERLLQISRGQDLFFAQTSEANLHVYEVESGRLLWSVSLGVGAPHPRPISANSFAVFAASANVLSALDRGTGRTIWKVSLPDIPTSGTACDEERVMVGMMNGRIIAYSLLETTPRGDRKIRVRPKEAWSWQTGGPIHTLPLPAEHVVAFGSDDGRVYVAMNDERTMLYRFSTGGAIGNGLGAYNTRTLLIPSADHNLYAVDLWTARPIWSFPSGAPIEQAPLITDDDILVINQRGLLSLVEPKTGQARWTTSTEGGQLVSVSGDKVYLRSYNNDLYEIDRGTGRVIADPAATLQRAGLNLREFGLSFLNRYDDRCYFATQSGVVVCLHQVGLETPRLLRDPNALPFGYIPPEGIQEPRPEETPIDDGEAAPEEAKDSRGIPEPEPDEF